MTEWKNVELELPDENKIVLGCDKFSSFVTLCRLIKDDDDTECDSYIFQSMYIDDVEGDCVITHWMNLPEAYND